VVWFIIGAIAVVFIFFGLGRQQGSMDLVTVNGEEADPYEFQDLLREASSRQRRGAPSPDDEQYARVAALHEQINRILTRQFGENLGLRPGPQALREAVAAIEAFQVDGRFNLERYQAALKSRRQGAADFEEELRRNLTSERAASLVQGLARTYRPELAELFHFQEDQVRFDYLFLADEDGRWDPRPAAGELEAYYAQRRENWRRPAEMTVQYVEISPDDYLGKAEFTEAELEDYYAQNQDRFIKPEAVLARRILFAFPSLNPKEAEKKTALDRAEAARARLDQGADFAALARELSDDRNTAKNGGDMGFMTRGSTFPELEEAAFSAPLNEAVGPVATDAGFNLIQVTARRPAAPSPLAEVRAELAGEFKTLLARRAAVDILENLLNRAEVNPDLADAAQGLGLRAALSRPFTSDDAPGFFENNSEAVQRAFSAPLDRVAPPFEGERILVLYVPRTRQESHIPPFEEMREEADRAWKREAADSLTRQRLESFLPEIRARGWEAYLAAKPSKSPVRSGAGVMTSRYALSVSPPFEKSDPRAVTALAFSAATPGQILPVSLAGQLNGRSGRFLLRLAEYQAADESRLDGSEGRTLEYLLDLNKSHLLLRTWQMGLYEASKDRIEIPPRFLQ
jgi:peptidyl-prolyl cis-trans isomerase D